MGVERNTIPIVLTTSVFAKITITIVARQDLLWMSYFEANMTMRVVWGLSPWALKYRVTKEFV